MNKKQCRHCGSDFKPLRKTSAYCSKPCARKKNGGHNRKAESWWVNSRGYIEGRIWVDGKQRRVKRHRWVMEQLIGRPLHPKEDVHHINSNKQDNAPTNLEILTHGQHSTKTNGQRKYKRGYKQNITDAQRLARSERARSIGLAECGRRAQGLG